MKFLKRIIIMVLLLFVTSCSHEQTEDIIILYTNDVASEIYNGVSYAGVKGYYDQMKSESKYVALVDAGDFYDGYISQATGGDGITKIMNAVGYDFVTIGNQEFSIGLDNLQRNIKEADFTFVSCNIKYTGRGRNKLRKVKPYVIKRFGPVRVAFIGVTTPETLIEGKPAYEAILEDGTPAYSFYEGNEGQDLYKQVQKTVDKVRKRVEYVVVISHLGSNSTAEGYSSIDLIENTTGIDVVIDGHSHTVNPGEAINNQEGQMVVLTSTGKELQNIGVLQMHADHTFTTVLYPDVEYKDANINALCQEIVESIN